MLCPCCNNKTYRDENICPSCGFFIHGLPCGTLLNNRYEILNAIKAGGMGAVYRAFDRIRGKTCAVKELFRKEDITSDSSYEADVEAYMVNRFMEEAGLLVDLEHPSIPEMIDFFTTGNDYYYLVMDYIEGKDLFTIVVERDGEGLSETLVLTWAMEICDVLRYLHSRTPPVLHRDINPANIILRTEDRRLFLVDFGLARTISDTGSIKTSVGTGAYTSMEQFNGRPEPRSDIYSLGATMHFLLTARESEPFRFVPVRKIRPDVSEFTEALIQKALNFLPEHRFSSADEMYLVLKGKIFESANSTCERDEGTYIEFDSEEKEFEDKKLNEEYQEVSLNMAKKEQGLFSRLFSKFTGGKDETPEKPPENITYELYILDGDEKGRAFELGYNPVAIGRRLPGDNRTTDILITDIEATISTEQARISWSPEHNVHVINFVAGTKNPTIIDGRMLAGPTLLSEGNQIIMGKNVIVYRRKLPCDVPQVSHEQPQTEYSFPAVEELPPPPVFIEEEIELIETGYMLKVISGLEEGKKFELNRPIISIGKLTVHEKKGWLLLDSSFVSPDQATLKWMAKERTYGIVHTKGAANPTFLNNKEISSDEFTMLEQGDVLRIGNIKMIVGRIPVQHDGIEATDISVIHGHSAGKPVTVDPGDAITLPRRIGPGGSFSRDIPPVPGKPVTVDPGDAITLPRRIRPDGSLSRDIASSQRAGNIDELAGDVSDEDEAIRAFRNRPRTPQATNYLDEEVVADYVEEHAVKPALQRRGGVFHPREPEKEGAFSAPEGPSDTRKNEDRKLPDMTQEQSRLRKGHGAFRPRSHDGEETIKPDFSRARKDGDKKISLPPKSVHYEEDDDDEEDDRTIMDQTMVAAWKDAHKFKVISGPDQGRVFIVSKEMVQGKLIIGSKGKIRKDIELSDDSISDSHGSLSFESDWLCINLEDENCDIFVNDMPVMKKGLENGDLIEIGTTILEYSYLGMESIVRASCEIEILEGPDKGKIFHLTKDKNYIGRKSKKAAMGKEIELSEKDRSVSRSHAFIEKKDKEYFLINEKEANVTILNGVQVVEPRPLVDGDKIKLGSETVLLFKQSKVPMVPKEKKVSTEGREKIEITHNTPQSLDEDMVFIEGGPFWMGVDHIECDANPMHKVHVESFYIDRYAVTNFQYEDFIRVTGYEPKGNWKEYFTAGKEYYPVTGVSYDDADAYAYWVGKRLPSEAEWEKAARGEEGLLYPWGKKWDSSRTCSEESSKAHTVPVDSFPEGQSPYGVMNMLGNIWEWTGDYYEKYPYKGPYPPDDEDREIAIRGGDYNTELKSIGVPVRNKIFPGEFGPTIGFRCAKSA